WAAWASKPRLDNTLALDRASLALARLAFWFASASILGCFSHQPLANQHVFNTNQQKNRAFFILNHLGLDCLSFYKLLKQE
ncbi:MAG: hypothetical protein KDB07_04160, partial [Planctomycetes bacterium]|nr:hypothetical protein [Planctomycetota bacterium]